MKLIDLTQTFYSARTMSDLPLGFAMAGSGLRVSLVSDPPDQGNDAVDLVGITAEEACKGRYPRDECLFERIGLHPAVTREEGGRCSLAAIYCTGRSLPKRPLRNRQLPKIGKRPAQFLEVKP